MKNFLKSCLVLSLAGLAGEVFPRHIFGYAILMMLAGFALGWFFKERVMP